MAAPYHDLYIPHFPNIRASRPTFLGFLNYTVTAASANPALKALSAGLQSAAALGGSVVAREGQDGTGKPSPAPKRTC